MNEGSGDKALAAARLLGVQAGDAIELRAL